MNKTYTAVYYSSSGRFYNAAIFLSSITISIRFIGENNELTDVYWLAENVLSLEEEAQGSVLKYKNKDGDTERLVIRDSELLQAIKKHFSHSHFVGGWKHHVLGNTRNKIALFISTLLTLILVGYFWFVPLVGERVANNISKEWEVSMGAKMHQSLMTQYKIDSFRTKVINRFFRELRYKVKYPITITVVDSKEINAFAVPGGHIVVYNSIIDHLKRPEELAALLSHEVSHIELRHSLRNIFRSMARKIFLLMVVGNESGLAGFLVDNADDLKGLAYSRSLETEADNYGIELMNSGDINPRGMLGLMEILQQETKGKEPAVFLSTHPVFDKRTENIREKIKGIDNKEIENKLLKMIFADLQNRGNTNW